MPHLTLEITANIQQEIDYDTLFSSLHQILSTTAGINIENCKSRAVRLDNFYIARGDEANAFVHLEIHFMQGRPADLLRAIGDESIGTLKEYFAPAINELRLQITVEITEFQRSSYYKFPTGTLK